MSGGGRLPGGDSPFDSIPVLARPGEWFIRNESARYWGDGFMAAVNEPFSALGRAIRERLQGLSAGGMVPLAAAALPRFAMGGPVSAPADMGNIVTQVGGGSYPVTGKIDVLAELKGALRREQLRRPR